MTSASPHPLSPAPAPAALDVVRAYHRAWTSGDYPAAVRLLAADLQVETPVNAYPTTASFAQALAGFGSLVTEVRLLCELADGDQAMLLYDLDAARIGTMRVAEHFTVTDGLITRLRQIHDTVAVRAAGLA